MKTILTVSGFIWMTISILVAAVIFSSIGSWEKKFVQAFGIKESAKYNGGEIMVKIDNGAYLTYIHRPVFDGLLGPTREGFIQIDWVTQDKKLPDLIQESFDYDKDGKKDFAITLDTTANSVKLDKFDSSVLAVLDRSSMGEFTLKGYPDSRFGVFSFGNGKSIRILLKNKEN
jgi:hypothetical protein